MARGEIVNRIDLRPYRFEALIFDCDGALVNSAPLIEIALVFLGNHFLKHSNVNSMWRSTTKQPRL
jgi:beta-phosphoglucomutase-like phosphatase (HAD superfamily)